MALYQRGRIWYVDFDINGQRVQTSTGTPNKREVERFMAKHMVAGDTAKPVRISLEEFGRRYMEYAKANKRSWIRDEQMLKQLNGFYGPALLSDIGALSVESYKRQRMNDVAPATLNREIALLKHMYDLAEAWGLHQGRNLVKGVRFLPENNLKLRTLSEEEEAKLLPCVLCTFATWFYLRCIPACDQAIYFDCNGRTSIHAKINSKSSSVKLSRNWSFRFPK